MNTLDAITTIIKLQEQTDLLLRNFAPEGFNLMAHYHYDKHAFSSSPWDKNYDEDHISFEIKNGEIITRKNNNFSGDIEETKKRLQEALALELSETQGKSSMKKLNADNGAFGDTPPQNPALETPLFFPESIDNFTVIAGKYEHNDELNIKFASGPVSFDEAIALQMEYSNYPFCYIQYKGLFISAFPSILEQAARPEA